MKILYLISKDMDPTGKKILEVQKGSHEVTVVDLRREKQYARVVDQIATADKVISW